VKSSAVEKSSRWWRREGRIVGADERLVSIDDMPIKGVAAIEKFQVLIDLYNRFTVFILSFIGLVAAGCIAGLPSTTCYALADAYTIALENIGQFIVFLIFLYYCVWILDYLNRNRWAVKANWIPKVAIGTVAFRGLIFSLLMAFLSYNGARNVRLAIDSCYEYTTDHEPHLHDRIKLYRHIIGGPTLED
jgi:hypothetical protein